MRQLAQDDTVQIDRSTRELPADEIDAVNVILSRQMQGYEVQPNAIWPDPPGPIENVRLRDFSPPLAELKAHFGPLVRDGVTPIEIPVESQALIDQESDLRMYLVRHVDWPISVPSITVLISRRGEGAAVASS